MEKNNSTATANTLALGDTMKGTFRASGDCDNDRYDCDVYRLSSDVQGRLTLDLQFSDSLGTEHSLNLWVLDSSGTKIYSRTISSADYDGSMLRGLAMYVDAGTFYVSLKARVSAPGRLSVWADQPYTLTAGVTKAVTETERNGSTATADVIDFGQTVFGSTFSGDCNNDIYDCDYFRLNLSEASKVQVDLRFTCDLGTERTYEISTLDNAGKRLSRIQLTGADCDGAAVRKAVVSAPKGNLYVFIYSRTGRVTDAKEYSLKVSEVIANTKAPTIAGTAKVGQTLAATPGTWSPSSVNVAYQWLRDGKAIKGATRPKYKLVAADAGKKIAVKVTASKDTYASASKTTAAKTVALQALTATPTPKVSGTAKVGKKLTAKPGTWKPSGVKLSYRWLRNGKSISGATKSTYTLKKADVGKKISVKVTGKKSGYKTVAKTSKATATVKK